jgi:hypothetical protein
MRISPWMRLSLLFVAATAVACESSAEPPEASAQPASPEQRPPATTPAESPTPTTAPPPAPSGPPPSGTKLYPGDRGFDCGRVLTRTEIEAACGDPIGTVNIDAMEGQRPLISCSRRWRHEDQRTVSMIIGKHADASAAGSLKTPPGATPLEGIGDAAHFYGEDRGGVIQWDTLRVRVGARVLYVRSITPPGREPLCDANQLATLAGEATGRLEQVVP